MSNYIKFQTSNGFFFIFWMAADWLRFILILVLCEKFQIVQKLDDEVFE